MAEYTRILSIDGGGIRGIIPGQVLVALEKKLQKATKRPNARIGEYFDLIAGTSTGGILTLFYLFPDPKKKSALTMNGSMPKFTAEQAVKLYLKKGDDIFDVSLGQKIRSVGGLIDEKYSADELEDILDEKLDGKKLSDLVGPCLITAYDIRRRRAKFFTSLDAQEIGGAHDYYLKDVARATSAAPTFFEVAKIQSTGKADKDFYPLIDGGVFANNPALCAYAEVRANFQNRPTAKDMVILSLGTGESKKSYKYGIAKNWGLMGWAKPVIDIMMSGVSETVHYQLKQIFDSIEKPEQYVRITTELDSAHSDMDDASPDNLKYLKNEGQKLARRESKNLDKIVKLLISKQTK